MYVPVDQPPALNCIPVLLPATWVVTVAVAAADSPPKFAAITT
jgi:hypothetical protein